MSGEPRLRASTADPAKTSALAIAMAMARELLPHTGNVGRSGDERDLYAVIEILAQGVRESHPQSQCQSGCSACCALHKALFRIFYSEWSALFDYILETWSPERIETFKRRFWEQTGPYLPLLEQIQRRMDEGERVRPPYGELPINCAFLENDRCAVYPARAAICRSFGYFGLRRTRDPDERPERPALDLAELEIYSCNLQRDALKQTSTGPRLQLPVFNTVYARLETLCVDEDKKLIPLWIARSFPQER